MGARRRRAILSMPRGERKKAAGEKTKPNKHFKRTLPRWGVVKELPVRVTQAKLDC